MTLTMEKFVIYIVCIFLLLLTWKVYQWIVYCSDRSIPGPRGVPIFGSALSVHQEKMHLTFYKWALQYGKIFRVKLFGDTVVVVNNFDEVRKLFAEKGHIDIFNDRPETFVGKYAVYNTSDVILSMENNESFIALKKILQKSLKRQSQTGTFRYSINAEMERLTETLDSFGGEDFELNPVIRESVASLISILMTGESVTTETNQRLWEFNDNTLFLLEASVNLFLTSFPAARYLPGKIGTVFKKMMSSRDLLIEKYFDGCKSDLDGSGDKGLVYDLLQVQRDENNNRGYIFLSDETIKGIILDLIVAAMKTTNTAVAVCILLLIRYPEHIRTIQKEIDEVIGLDRFPEQEDQAKMPFCRAFIHEMLRYISFGTLGLPHLVNRDCQVDEYKFKKNDIILSNIWFIHHDPNFWEKPWDFCPSRFLDEDGKLLPASHQKMRTIANFSVGRRVCIGKDIALNRVFLYMTNILQKFEIHPSTTGPLPDADPTYFNPGLILEPQTFSCRLVRRTDIGY